MATLLAEEEEDEVDSGETRIRVAVRLRPYNEKEMCAVENRVGHYAYVGQLFLDTRAS
jgi:hypothetical protein